MSPIYLSTCSNQSYAIYIMYINHYHIVEGDMFIYNTFAIVDQCLFNL
jgi:hypothetical protein